MKNIDFFIREFEVNLSNFKLMFGQIDEEMIKWRKDENSWCCLEVICHLLDEELEDFKLRMQLMLDHPKDDFKPIDPEAWIKSRDYISKDYEEICQFFYLEREASIAFLKQIKSEEKNWAHRKIHDHFGELSAQFFLDNWLAHDYLHMRQLIKIKYDYIHSISIKNIEYAGTWK